MKTFIDHFDWPRPLIALALATLCTACNTAVKGRIVETEGRALQAIGVARDEGDARIAALDEATKFCKAKLQRPIFRSRELHDGTRNRDFELNLKNLPLIGKAFKGEDKVQVLMTFRCAN